MIVAYQSPFLVVSQFVRLIILITLVSMVLISCGGGGGTQSTNEPLEDVPTESADQSSSDNTGDEESDGVTDTGTETGVETDEGNENSSGEDESDGIESTMDGQASDEADESVVVGQDTPFYLFEDRSPAPASAGRVLGNYSRGDFDINRSGRIALAGKFRVFPDEIYALWGGTVFEPKLLLETNDMVPGFPTSVRVSRFSDPVLTPDGTVGTLATMSGASDSQAVLRFRDDAEPDVIARTGAATTITGGSVLLADIVNFDLESGSVAYVGSVQRLQPVLFVYDGTDTVPVAPARLSNESDNILDPPLQSDGCRLLFDDADSPFDSSYQIAPDGSVIFQSRVTVEASAIQNPAICQERFEILNPTSSGTKVTVGNNFSAVVRYKNGDYKRLVSRGDAVPGMANSVFVSVSFRNILEDGSVVVAATFKDLSEGTTRDAVFLYSNSVPPRLVVMEDETFEAAQMSLADFSPTRFGTELNATGAETMAMLYEADVVSSSNNDVWLLVGSAHSAQPYPQFASTGAGSLVPFAFTGSPAPTGYPDSVYFSSLGNLTVTPDGGFFIGSLADASDAGGVIATGIWRYNLSGEITQVLFATDTLLINEIPRPIESLPTAFSSGDLYSVGADGLVFFETALGVTRLVYVPLD